jgi:hypothetical protein
MTSSTGRQSTRRTRTSASETTGFSSNAQHERVVEVEELGRRFVDDVQRQRADEQQSRPHVPIGGNRHFRLPTPDSANLPFNRVKPRLWCPKGGRAVGECWLLGRRAMQVGGEYLADAGNGDAGPLFDGKRMVCGLEFDESLTIVS